MIVLTTKYRKIFTDLTKRQKSRQGEKKKKNIPQGKTEDCFVYSVFLVAIWATCLIFFDIWKTLVASLVLIFCLPEAGLHGHCWKTDCGPQAELKNGLEPRKGETANGGEKSD